MDPINGPSYRISRILIYEEETFGYVSAIQTCYRPLNSDGTVRRVMTVITHFLSLQAQRLALLEMDVKIKDVFPQLKSSSEIPSTSSE